MPVGGFMLKSRRQFLTQTSLSLLAAGTVSRGYAQQSSDLPPGAPPAFGTGPAVGPEVSTTTFAEAEELVQFEMTAAEGSVAAGGGGRFCRGRRRVRSGSGLFAAASILVHCPRRTKVLRLRR